MKKLVTLACLLVLCLATRADTNITTATVSGHWTLAGSPYKVFNDISVAGSTSLVIDPGVEVIFQGPYKISVSGIFRAKGTSTSPILFHINDTTGFSNMSVSSGGWHGISYSYYSGPAGADSSRLEYCNVRDVKFQTGASGYTYAFYLQRTLTVKNCSFYSCLATTVVQLSTYSGNTATIDSCNIYNNTASSIVFSAYSNHLAQTRITNSKIYNNSSANIVIDLYSLSNLLFNKNEVYQNAGNQAILATEGDSLVTVSECKIHHNTGIRMVIASWDGRADYVGNLICNNQHTEYAACGVTNGGGGIYLMDGVYNVKNNIIANNLSPDYGGGIEMFQSSINIVNNTIVNNRAQHGAGIYINATMRDNLVIKNNLITGNVEDYSPGNVSGWGKTFLCFENNWLEHSYTNDVDLSSPCTMLGDTLTNFTGTTPRMVAPTTVAGISQDATTANFSLMGNSPCINTGNLAGIAPTTLDYAGNPRVAGNIDVGAYEYVQIPGGVKSVCPGYTTTLTANITGGTWSSGNTSVATVGSSSGIVTGVTAGTANITYSAGSSTYVAMVTVTSTPALISGTNAMCVGAASSLSAATMGGTWTSSNTAVAGITSSGVVSGVATGTATISYSLPSSCVATYEVTVSNTPSAIVGDSALCAGSLTTMSCATPGGTWSTNDYTIVSIGASSGVVHGIDAKFGTIYYTAGGCTVSKPIHIKASPVQMLSPDIYGCAGTNVTFYESTPGGIWSSSNTAVANINYSTGVAHCSANGTTIIRFTLTSTGCAATGSLTVFGASLAISGSSKVCIGQTTTLSSTVDTVYGNWSSSSYYTATVDYKTGVVTGVHAGTATITYSRMGFDCTRVTKVVTVSATPTISPTTQSTCPGTAITFTGTPTAGTWSTGSTTYITVVSTTGVVTGVAAGTGIVTYTNSGCSATRSVPVVALPSAITGTMALCAGATSALSNTYPGGTWSTSSSSIATIGSTTGVLTGVATGTTTITYSRGPACSRAFVTATVNASVGTISGPGVVCNGTTATLTNSASGGSWTSSTTSVATIGSSTGIVTGIATGTTTITYSTGATCKAFKVVTVSTLASVTGTATLCAGTNTTLSNSTSGGTWSSSNTSVATVGATGIVAGVGAGTVNISYSLSAGCYALRNVTVNAVSAGTITGTPNVCVGNTISLSGTVSGGNWSSSNIAVASVGSASGVATGVASGTSVISYSVSNSCGTANATKVVTVNPVSSAGIVADALVCEGATVTMSSTVPGGTWSGGGSGISLTTAGVVTGVTTGTALVTYTVNSCGTSMTTAIVTVNPAPDAGTIIGTTILCPYSTTTLTGSVGGGTWSSDNDSVATISAGVLTGVNTGSLNITYTVTNSCGSAYATVTATVNPQPGLAAISSLPVVCVETTTTLNAVFAGGTWSSTNTAVATIDPATGVMTGISTGTTVISYIISSSCGSSEATVVATVNATGAGAATITGSSGLCEGAAITLSSSMSGGTWSSSNAAVATIGSTGLLDGISAGAVIIDYTTVGDCGISVATHMVTVDQVPSAGDVSGTLSVCTGATVTLSSTVAGGEWLSDNISVATVDAASGMVSGIATGTSTITYTVANSCGSADAVMVLTVAPTASAGTITGSASVFIGSTITLGSTVTGGTWSGSNSFGTVSAGGVVTGIAAGTLTVSYSVGNSCGTAVTTNVVTVNPLVEPIVGVIAICSGQAITLTDATTGGVWSSNNSTIASISADGIVTGGSPGVAIITYSISSGGYATASITVNSLPAAITGITSVCAGSATNLSTTTMGGVWSSGSVGVATISTSGVVTGSNPGTALISYTNSNGCVRSVAVTVNETPSIVSAASLCPGSTFALDATLSGGAWTGGSATIATVSSAGVVTGITAGTTNVTYTMSGGCRVITTVTVSTAPPAIGGTLKVCPGSTTILTNSTTGGSWASDNTAIATVGASDGIVTGVTDGTVMISYATGAGCLRTAIVTVSPAPAAISGSTTVCAGTSAVLSNSLPTLSWASSNTAVATIGATTGMLTGVSNGTAVITFTAAVTSCTTTSIVTVNSAPANIDGPSTSCLGSTITLSNTLPGGTWSSSNTAVVTIGSGNGVVSGVVTGTAYITYATGAGCFKTKMITINSQPVVTGYPIVCLGLTTTLSGGAYGTWVSSDPTVATVAVSGGYVAGVTAGTSAITYTSTATGCTALSIVTVIPVPSAITGATIGCQGTTVTLSNSTAGGSWSTSNTAVATVSAAGVVTAVGSGGTATISYSFGTNCRVTTPFSPKPMPVAIGGSPSICTPLTTTLTCTTGGGTWTSSDVTVATVGTAISVGNGVVTGVAAGTSNITYTITTTGCARSVVVTVNAGLNPGTITSSGGFTLHTVSAPTSVTLSTTGATGGTWTSSNAAVATVDATTGVVNAVSAGSTTITYSVTNSCTNNTTKVISVTAGRAAGNDQPVVSSMQLYPNPTTGAFTVVTDEAGTLKVYSLEGRQATSFDMSKGVNNLVLPRELAAAVYMCRFTSDSGGTTMVRLVKSE